MVFYVMLFYLNIQHSIILFNNNVKMMRDNFDSYYQISLAQQYCQTAIVKMHLHPQNSYNPQQSIRIQHPSLHRANTSSQKREGFIPITISQQISLKSGIGPERTAFVQQSQSVQPVQRTQEQMTKIMHMMREQIQIASNFYENKMRSVFIEQAKQITKLRTQLQRNQAELNKKTAMLSQFKEAPKKKISLVSNNQADRFTSEFSNQINDKIAQLQTKIYTLSDSIQNNVQQNSIKNKIEKLQKGVINYFACKIKICSQKINNFISQKDTKLQKILTSQTNSGGSNSQTYQRALIKMTKLHRDMQQTQIQIKQMKAKQYRYDSFEVEKLKQQIDKLKIATNMKQMVSTQNCYKQIQSKEQILINKNIRSDRRIEEPIYYNSIGPSQKMNNTTNINNSTTLKSNQRLFTQDSPALIRNLSDGNYKNKVQYSKLERSARIATEQLFNRDNSPGVTKTEKLSTQASRPPLKPSLQKQFYEQQQWGSEQPEQQEQTSSCESYQDFGEQSEEEDLEQRLISTLRYLNIKMPVLVQIDQTGCLKCVSTGMYLVDCNSDVFYLNAQHLSDLSQKGVIKVNN